MANLPIIAVVTYIIVVVILLLIPPQRLIRRVGYSENEWKKFEKLAYYRSLVAFGGLITIVLMLIVKIFII